MTSMPRTAFPLHWPFWPSLSRQYLPAVLPGAGGVHFPRRDVHRLRLLLRRQRPDCGRCLSECRFHHDLLPGPAGRSGHQLLLQPLCPRRGGHPVHVVVHAAAGEPDGVYTGFDLQGVDIWSQMDDVVNASGCITWQFTSDATENSNWTAEVTCEEPCQRPEANVVTTIDGAVETVPLQICVGERKFNSTAPVPSRPKTSSSPPGIGTSTTAPRTIQGRK